MEQKYFKETGKHGFYMDGSKTAAYKKWLGELGRYRLMVFRSVV